MNRILAVLVVVQFLVIIVLSLALFRAEGTIALDQGAQPVREETRPEEGSIPRRSPLDSAGTLAADENQSHERIDQAREEKVVDVVLYGSITDPEGRPLEASRIIEDEEGTRTHEQAKGGHYSAAGLTPGRWKLELKAEGYRAFEAELELGEAPAHRLDVVLHPAVVLNVKVLTPEGEPLGPKLDELGTWVSLVAVATDAPPQRDLPMTPHRSQSRYGLGSFEEGQGFRRRDDPMKAEFIGRIELSVDLPVHVSLVLRHVVLATKLVEPGSSEVEFRLAKEDVVSRLSAFRVKLVDDATGEAITKAMIDISDRQSSTPRRMESDDGVFMCGSLRPGLMTLSLSATGYGGRSHYIMLRPGETLDLGTLRLKPPGQITGRVVDEKGEGTFASLSLRCLDTMTFPQPLDYGRSWSSTPDGAIEITGCAAGRYLVLANTKEGKIAFGITDVQSGTESKLELKLRPAVVLEVHSNIGTSDYLLVRIVDPAGLPVYARYLWGSWTGKASLAAGSYRLEIYRDLEILSTREIEVRGDKVVVEVP